MDVETDDVVELGYVKIAIAMDDDETYPIVETSDDMEPWTALGLLSFAMRWFDYDIMRRLHEVDPETYEEEEEDDDD